MGLWGARVVIVDPDPRGAGQVALAIQDGGAEAILIDNPGEALATAMGVIPDLVIVSLAIPRARSFGLVRVLRAFSPERGGRTPVVSTGPAPLDPAAWDAAGFQLHIPDPAAPAGLSLLAALAGTRVERRRTTTPSAWPEGVRRERRHECRRVELAPARVVA